MGLWCCTILLTLLLQCFFAYASTLGAKGPDKAHLSVTPNEAENRKRMMRRELDAYTNNKKDASKEVEHEGTIHLGKTASSGSHATLISQSAPNTAKALGTPSANAKLSLNGISTLRTDVVASSEGAGSYGKQLTRVGGAATTAAVSRSNTISWKKHSGMSCQGYADGDSTTRSLNDAKAACLKNEVCVAIECPKEQHDSCTLRANANPINYDPADCYEQLEVNELGVSLSSRVHPAYRMLLKEYPFQQVITQSGNQVNIILVRAHMDSNQRALYEKYKDDILFLGISSMNDYPLESDKSTEYVNMFPGFLHMMREPDKFFPPTVKTLLMSQSDFSLPDYPARNYSIPRKYDFTYSASDCDVATDGDGWCGWSKNWTFAKQALKVMCEEYNLTGVLVATRDKQGKRSYSIPDSCKGKMKQTTYLADQRQYFNFLKQSRFAFLPQVHDASPRVATQALALDVPILMNWHIKGGWKYVNDQTGEFFHDLSDFRQSLTKLLRNADTPYRYQPRKWVLEHFGNANSGKRLLKFVQEHFSHRVKLPKGTKLLLT